MTNIFTADPSAHVFEGKIYIYPSHDIDAGLPEDDLGGHFDMEDYDIPSMDSPLDKQAKDHGLAMHMKDIPYGPFKHKGVILNPVIGWTSHHSVVEFQGKWYLFYYDSTLSGGTTHLRCVKVTELKHKADGTIETINAYK